jgi:hypothetical protein
MDREQELEVLLSIFDTDLKINTKTEKIVYYTIKIRDEDKLLETENLTGQLLVRVSKLGKESTLKDVIIEGIDLPRTLLLTLNKEISEIVWKKNLKKEKRKTTRNGCF